MSNRFEHTAISRRSLLAGMSAVPITLAASRAFAQVAFENESAALQQLYQAALADRRKLVVYAGGDTPTQQDATKKAFTSRFPGVDIDIVVDYSKFHDVCVDNQFATRNVIPDVVQLQTLNDFTRWKAEGKLLPFKPEGFGQIHDIFKDPDGAWLSVGVLAFSFMYDPASPHPASPKDFIKPEWKGKIASSYPHDDDAVLYLYKLYAEAYGWDWVAAMAKQDIAFARGSHSPRLAVTKRERVVGIGGSGSLTATDPQVRWTVTEGHPFMAWGQRAAILKGAKAENAAKLYLAWQVSAERQSVSYNGWSLRRDVRAAGGLKPIWEYENANLKGFPAFMEDRASIERWKQTFALYFGEVKGDATPGSLGLRPGV